MDIATIYVEANTHYPTCTYVAGEEELNILKERYSTSDMEVGYEAKCPFGRVELVFS